MQETIPLAAGDAEVAIVPGVGGAVAAFAVDGVDVLRRATPEAIAGGDVCAFASYPLVPCSNRIAQAQLRVGRASYRLSRNFGNHPHAIHGVGWQRAWQVTSRGPQALAIELVHAPRDGDAQAWPFAFRARQSFAIGRDTGATTTTLTMTIGIASEDARPFPFGLGFHPFFVRRPGTALGFRADGVWQTDATGLPAARTAVPADWRFEPARELRDAAIDNVFTGWNGTATVEWPREGLRATLEADRALSHLVVYVPAAGGHFAVEPATHMTDAFNRAAAGESGTGARTLRPGESFSCTMRIIVTAHSR
jgi:aldose 1-epimerase